MNLLINNLTKLHFINNHLKKFIYINGAHWKDNVFPSLWEHMFVNRVTGPRVILEWVISECAITNG